jgi:AraC-like DNA-binding protein
MTNDMNTLAIDDSAVDCIAGFVRQSGIARHDASRGSCPRDRGAYTLAYVLDGRCLYSDFRGRGRVLERGDLFVGFPDTPRRFAAVAGEPWTEFRLTFGGPMFDLWSDLKILDKEDPVHRLEPVEYWLSRFEALLGRVPPASAEAIITIAGLQQLLAEAFAFEKTPHAMREDRAWLAQAQARLHAVERVDEVDLREIASSLNMSYANFRRKFAQLSGMPAGKYHITALIGKTCRLIQATSLTNKEIAQRYGFCSEFHFSSRFKQIVGVSPREFRKRQAPAASSPSGQTPGSSTHGHRARFSCEPDPLS